MGGVDEQSAACSTRLRLNTERSWTSSHRCSSPVFRIPQSPSGHRDYADSHPWNRDDKAGEHKDAEASVCHALVDWAPISVLPTELLSHIIRHLTRLTVFGTHLIDADDLLACSQVCRYWRQAALGFQMPWSFIDISWRESRTRSWIERAGVAPLNFYFHEHPSRSWDSTARYHELLRRVQCFGVQTYRCETLSVSVCTQQVMTTMWWMTQQYNFPCLKSIESFHDQVPRHSIRPISARRVQGLTSLDIRRGIFIHADLARLAPTLESLTLTDSLQNGASWVSILSQCTALKRLSITRGGGPATQPAIEIAPFTLPSLEVLTLNAPDASLMELLAINASVPALHTLYLSLVGERIRMIPTLLVHLDTVRSLHIKDTPKDADDLLRVLAPAYGARADQPLMRSLVDLEIILIPFVDERIGCETTCSPRAFASGATGLRRFIASLAAMDGKGLRRLHIGGASDGAKSTGWLKGSAECVEIGGEPWDVVM